MTKSDRQAAAGSRPPRESREVDCARSGHSGTRAGGTRVDGRSESETVFVRWPAIDRDARVRNSPRRASCQV